MRMKPFKVRMKRTFHNYEWKAMVKIASFITILFFILFDQVIKNLIITKFEKDKEYPFLPGFINIKYVINKGSAFGFNQNQTVALIVIAFIISFILLIWWVFSRTNSNIVVVTFIFSGTIGNLIDRFNHDGGVVDFLMWDLFNPKTIFNIADIMIIIGIIIFIVRIIVDFVKTFIHERKERAV